MSVSRKAAKPPWRWLATPTGLWAGQHWGQVGILAPSQGYLSHGLGSQSGMTQPPTSLSVHLPASHDWACRGDKACFTHFHDPSPYTGTSTWDILRNVHALRFTVHVLDFHSNCTTLFHPHEEPLGYRQHVWKSTGKCQGRDGSQEWLIVKGRLLDTYRNADRTAREAFRTSTRHQDTLSGVQGSCPQSGCGTCVSVVAGPGRISE